MKAPSRVRCLIGTGMTAPCPDDLCHGVDTTLCGLEYGFDFCEHDQDPDSCEECNRDNEWDWGDDYEEDADANPA